MRINKGKRQTLELSALLKGLNEAGIEFILVGGMAAVAQGAVHATGHTINRMYYCEGAIHG